MKREVLVNSLEGRPVEMLTISGRNGITDEREELLEGLFPESDQSKRPFKFKGKKYVWISSRVHPGEVPASHMMNGFLGYLLSDPAKDIKVKLSLHHFVFIIVPILNPDGVYRGHYRTDTHGNNLNRCYMSPSPTLTPTIFGVEKMIEYLHNTHGLFMYLDLHAHANINNIFMFGNTLEYHSQIQSCLFPFILAMNNPLFDYGKCILNNTSKSSEEKEGAGRVYMQTKFNILHSYTLEAGYNICTSINKLVKPSGGTAAEAFFTTSGAYMKNSVCEDLLNKLENYKLIETHKSTYFMTQRDFECMGKDILPSLLDLIDRNPFNRVYNTPLSSMRSLKLYLAYKIFKTKPYSFNPYLGGLLSSGNVGLYVRYVEDQFIDKQVADEQLANALMENLEEKEVKKVKKVKKKKNNEWTVDVLYVTVDEQTKKKQITKLRESANNIDSTLKNAKKLQPVRAEKYRSNSVKHHSTVPDPRKALKDQTHDQTYEVQVNRKKGEGSKIPNRYQSTSMQRIDVKSSIGIVRNTQTTNTALFSISNKPKKII